MTNYESVKAYRSRKPWARPREWARRRCLDPKHREYPRYGGRGIQFNLTMGEAKFLFIRDDGYKLAKPSLDRIDPDKGYTLNNCRFIELLDNIRNKRPRGSIKYEDPISERELVWEE